MGIKSNKRWRILNINGKPVLQTADKGQRFEEVKENQEKNTNSRTTQPQNTNKEQNQRKEQQDPAQDTTTERGEKQKNTLPMAVPIYGYN